MNIRRNRYLAALMRGVLVAASVSSAAARVTDVTETEYQLIPSYCRHTQGFTPGSTPTNVTPEARRWIAVMGETWWHMHHYCSGHIELRRADNPSISAAERQGYRGRALQEMWYVPRNSPPDFILLPEMYTWIGRIEISLRSPEKANKAFAHARELKPEYWPAYFHWAEYLFSVGKKKEALAIVKAGLQHSPNAKALIALLRELGGKEEDIAPQAPKIEANPGDPR